MQHALRFNGRVDQANVTSPDVIGGMMRCAVHGAPEDAAVARDAGQASVGPRQGMDGAVAEADASADIAAMRAALGLQTIVRYLGQRHWDEETAHAIAGDQAEPGLKLENVAAHSWQVADAALLLAPQFPELSIARTVQLAVVHDKLEMITGDFDPVGSDGRGTDSHAFDTGAQRRKRAAELSALDDYLKGVREPSRRLQRELLLDAIEGTSIEARFVKAVDKLQALIYVIEKKKGSMSDDHVDFSIRYTGKAIGFFPGLATHCRILFKELLHSVAVHRATCDSDVEARLSPAAVDILRRGRP